MNGGVYHKLTHKFLFKNTSLISSDLRADKTNCINNGFTPMRAASFGFYKNRYIKQKMEANKNCEKITTKYSNLAFFET